MATVAFVEFEAGGKKWLVSTVSLSGLGIVPFPEGLPSFETLVRRGGKTVYTMRWATARAAVRGHRWVVGKIRSQAKDFLKLMKTGEGCKSTK